MTDVAPHRTRWGPPPRTKPLAVLRGGAPPPPLPTVPELTEEEVAAQGAFHRARRKTPEPITPVLPEVTEALSYLRATVRHPRAPIRPRAPITAPGPEELLDWAGTWFDLGFRYIHVLYSSCIPLAGYQENSAEDLDDLRVMLDTPGACGLGYNAGRQCIRGVDELGRPCFEDVLVFDLDDREEGRAQYVAWVRSVQEEWLTHPQRDRMMLSFPEYFGPDGVLLPPPPTLAFGSPSRGLQMVYRADHMEDAWIVGQRLGPSLEVKGAAADGAACSCRLPPTVRQADGDKPAGRYVPFPRAPREVVRLFCPYVIRLQEGSDAATRKKERSTEPPQVDGRYVVTEYARDQALRRAAAAVETIENFEARSGRRRPINNQTLYAAKLGWALSPAEQRAVVRMLIAAAVSIGWPRPKAEETVGTAWRDGMQKPEDVRRSAFNQPPAAAEGEQP